MHILCVLASVVAEKEGYTVKRSQADCSVDDSGDKCEIGTENGCHQVKVENSYQSPVQTTNNHQYEYQFFQSYHSFRMYFAPKVKKYDIIKICMRKNIRKRFRRGKRK